MYLNDPTVKAASLTYRELGDRYPQLKALFDATTISVIVVRTADLDLIEEMFSRLNEAVPLNAAERRNALGGPVPEAIRRVAKFPFFKRRVYVSNKRYQHRELAAKLLYLADAGKEADTKKVYLDEFVKRYRNSSHSRVRPLVREVRKALSAMDKVFVRRDKLLRSPGVIVLYFLLFKDGIKRDWRRKISRAALERFERARAENRERAQRDITKADYDLLEFDRLTQTPNDAYAMRLRLQTLKKFLRVKD